MEIDYARSILAQLGNELRRDPDAFKLDESGEAYLSYEDRTDVLIRYVEGVLILGSVVAEDIDPTVPDLFAILMDYQFLGVATMGCGLSWNASSDSLILSRQLHGAPGVDRLAEEIDVLLRATVAVREDLIPILSGQADLSLSRGTVPTDSGGDFRSAGINPGLTRV